MRSNVSTPPVKLGEKSQTQSKKPRIRKKERSSQDFTKEKDNCYDSAFDNASQSSMYKYNRAATTEETITKNFGVYVTRDSQESLEFVGAGSRNKRLLQLEREMKQH